MVPTNLACGIKNTTMRNESKGNSQQQKARQLLLELSKTKTPTPTLIPSAAATQLGITNAVPATKTTNDACNSKLRAKKSIWKTVTVFLASGKRNSHISLKNETSVRRKHFRKQSNKMNETSSKINTKLMEYLRKKTRFNKYEIEALFRIYRKLMTNSQYAAKTLMASSSNVANGKPCKIEGIDRIAFREMLQSTFDIITEEVILERIFCNWDRLHEGLPIRLESWLTGLSVFLRGTPTERATFCFSVYDLNSDGYLTKDEIFTLLRNCLLKQPQDEDPDEGVRDLVEIVLRKFDLDKDGKISLEDYMGVIKAEPLLIEAFGQCLPSDNAVMSFLSTL